MSIRALLPRWQTKLPFSVQILRSLPEHQLQAPPQRQRQYNTTPLELRKKYSLNPNNEALEDFRDEIREEIRKGLPLPEILRNAIWEGRNGEARRDRVAKHQEKRRKIADGQEAVPTYVTEFSKEDIEAEERKPKKKCAVFLGYSGSGYRGMQIDPLNKTIEGDLFKAFVEAGAISKANADDPKKSSLVRCARTDKGVHAAGNIISLKLIQGDPDIVSKINDKLSEQIRVWGIQRVNNSFSCYQLCDSRIYEYLIPTLAFLPPHPSSFLGKKLDELAKEVGDEEGYRSRQEEVSTWWETIDRDTIAPLVKELPDDIRDAVVKGLWNEKTEESESSEGAAAKVETKTESTEDAAVEAETKTESTAEEPAIDEEKLLRVAEAVKSIRIAYHKMRQTYRIDAARLKRVQAAFETYVGTKRFHNYTVQKKFTDASSQRHIKSFVVSDKPIVIGDTEWLSLKVHGASFMMHQIRKMVSLATLTVRCGSKPEIINESFKNVRMAIPKAPGLGLLLERPVFESFNARAAKTLKDVEPIRFEKWEKEMEEFKNREIYERIFREEEEIHAFSNFFNHVDSYTDPIFLYLSSKGLAAVPPGAMDVAKNSKQGKAAAAIPSGFDSEPEDEAPVGTEGDG